MFFDWVAPRSVTLRSSRPLTCLKSNESDRNGGTGFAGFHDAPAGPSANALG